MGVLINDNNGIKPQNPFVGCQVTVDGRTEIYDGSIWKKVFYITDVVGRVKKIREGKPFSTVVESGVIVTMGGKEVAISEDWIVDIPSVSGDIVMKYAGEGENGGE